MRISKVKKIISLSFVPVIVIGSTLAVSLMATSCGGSKRVLKYFKHENLQDVANLAKKIATGIAPKVYENIKGDYSSELITSDKMMNAILKMWNAEFIYYSLCYTISEQARSIFYQYSWNEDQYTNCDVVFEIELNSRTFLLDKIVVNISGIVNDDLLEVSFYNIDPGVKPSMATSSQNGSDFVHYNVIYFEASLFKVDFRYGANSFNLNIGNEILRWCGPMTPKLELPPFGS